MLGDDAKFLGLVSLHLASLAAILKFMAEHLGGCPPVLGLVLRDGPVSYHLWGHPMPNQTVDGKSVGQAVFVTAGAVRDAAGHEIPYQGGVQFAVSDASILGLEIDPPAETGMVPGRSAQVTFLAPGNADLTVSLPKPAGGTLTSTVSFTNIAAETLDAAAEIDLVVVDDDVPPPAPAPAPPPSPSAGGVVAPAGPAAGMLTPQQLSRQIRGGR